MEPNITLQLGDIIEIESPANKELDKKIFFIKYIDNEKIILVDNQKQQILNIKPTGELYEETIESINILSRAKSPSYAEQNNYIPGTWISIYFKGTFPIIINGIITNLENDMIEIKTYPKNDIIYIDFEYKGIPEGLNIETIKLIDESDIVIEGVEKSTKEDTDYSLKSLEDDEYNYKEDLKEILLEADAIEIGEDLEAITQEIKVDEDQYRYSISKQLDDLLDDILSNIPNTNRNETTLNNVNLEIERFRQLREMYSNFDNINSIKDINYLSQKNPLVDNLKKSNYNLSWIIPVITNLKRIYDVNDSNSDDNRYILQSTMLDLLTQVNNLNNEWKGNQIGNDENKYRLYIKKLFDIFDPYMPNDDNDEYISNEHVNNNIEAVIDNTDRLENYGLNNNILSTKKYDTTLLNTSIKMLKTEYDMISSLTYQVNIKENDRMSLKGLLLLPEKFINFSNINLHYSNILQKSNLNQYPEYNHKILRKKKIHKFLCNK